MSFEFLTFLAYSPRGKSEIEISSRTVAGSCKNGDVSFFSMTIVVFLLLKAVMLKNINRSIILLF